MTNQIDSQAIRKKSGYSPIEIDEADCVKMACEESGPFLRFIVDGEVVFEMQEPGDNIK